MQGFDLSTATNITLGATGVNSVYLGSTLIWPLSHDYSRDYLTIVSLADNNRISLVCGGDLAKTIYVSTDNGTTWTSKTGSGDGTILATLNTDDKLLVKGNNSTYSSSDGMSVSQFTCDSVCTIEGNIMSLVYGDNFIGQTTLTADYTFTRLFSMGIARYTHNLILPATTLTKRCYADLFLWSYIMTAPALPATTLAEGCYAGMFYEDYSYDFVPPALPATTLAKDCYYDMFRGCTALTTAPILPATTLAENSYRAMFKYCSNIQEITCLATDISATNCTYDWLDGVNATGTFYKNANMSNWSSGSSGIPSGWTVQDYQ